MHCLAEKIHQLVYHFKPMSFQSLFSRDTIRSQMCVSVIKCMVGCMRHIQAADCSLTVKDSWEVPEDGGVPPGICFSTICSPPPLKRFHANCCTALTFNLRIHMHGHKPTADACGRKSPPSCLIFSFSPLKWTQPVICRFQLADCGDMQRCDVGKYSHSH